MEFIVSIVSDFNYIEAFHVYVIKICGFIYKLVKLVKLRFLEIKSRQGWTIGPNLNYGHQTSNLG